MAKTKDEPQIEDVDEEDSSDDDSDDVPELEEADGSARGKQSKMEKKSRSVLLLEALRCALATSLPPRELGA